MDTQATPNQTRRSRREVHTADMEIGQRSPIALPNDGFIVREPEEIVAVESPIGSDYAADLAFMEEMVTIRLERSAEKFAPQFIDVYVNGAAKWVPVGVPVSIPRKYVEVLARAKPDDVQTEVITPQDQDPINQVVRNTRAKYPFSVIRDDNPKGYAWLTAVMADQA